MNLVKILHDRFLVFTTRNDTFRFSFTKYDLRTNQECHFRFSFTKDDLRTCILGSMNLKACTIIYIESLILDPSFPSSNHDLNEGFDAHVFTGTHNR